MAQGDFSASQLLQIKLKAEQMWTDSASSAEFQPNANAAVAVLEHQTARFNVLSDREKDNSVKVTWIKACDIAVADCTSNCDLTEPEVETVGKDYTFDICKKVGFSINAEKLRKNTYNFDEVVAPSLAKSIKLLDEYWASRVLLKAKTFASRNLAVSPFTWDSARNATVVPNTIYGNQLAASGGFLLTTLLTKQAIQNKLISPYYIDNGRSYIEYQNSLLMAKATTGNDAAGMTRAQALDISFDLFNFPASGVTNVSTFAIGRNAMAFKAYNRNPDVPEVIGGTVQQTRYTVPSIALKGVYYDVYYGLKCVTNNVTNKAEIVHTWRLETNGGIWLNPEGCPVTIGGIQYTPTGVLSYVSSDELV